MFHSETDFAPEVVKYVKKHGKADFQELYKHLQKAMNLTEEDLTPTPSGVMRWHQHVRNLKSNRSLEGTLVRIPRGFASFEYAAKQLIPEGGWSLAKS